MVNVSPSISDPKYAARESLADAELQALPLIKQMSASINTDISSTKENGLSNRQIKERPSDVYEQYCGELP